MDGWQPERRLQVRDAGLHCKSVQSRKLQSELSQVLSVIVKQQGNLTISTSSATPTFSRFCGHVLFFRGHVDLICWTKAEDVDRSSRGDRKTTIT